MRTSPGCPRVAQKTLPVASTSSASCSPAAIGSRAAKVLKTLGVIAWLADFDTMAKAPGVTADGATTRSRSEPGLGPAPCFQPVTTPSIGDVHVGPPGAVDDMRTVMSPQELMAPSVVPSVTEGAALLSCGASGTATTGAASTAVRAAVVRASREVRIP